MDTGSLTANARKALPGFGLGLLATAIVTFVTFSFNYGKLENRIAVLEERASRTAFRAEVQAVREEMRRGNDDVIKRFSTVEGKVDSIYVILINRK
jgi:hypothetical protein